MSDRLERLALGLVLVVVVAHRGHHLDQPIHENYVGRQVPTAMVARNLERGSGFLSPQLDTGPFPNLFLIEPPVYGQVVVVARRMTGLPLEPAGRLVSAVGMAMAAWGLHGIARRRLGRRAALLAAAALATFPLTIRYGRAFQPDSLMLGMSLAGLRSFDAFAHGAGRSRWGHLGLAAVLLATAMALKVIAAVVVVPLVLGLWTGRARWALAFAGLALVPGLLWYAHAAALAQTASRSLAPAENFRIWAEALRPSLGLDPDRWRLVGRFLLIRSFTPAGIVLGVLGLVLVIREECRCSSKHLVGWAPPTILPHSKMVGGAHPTRNPACLWSSWLVGGCLFLAAFAEKLHHEYYLLLIAPLVAVGVGVVLDRVLNRGMQGRVAFGLLTSSVLVMVVLGSRSTFRTPDEWRDVPEAASLVRDRVPSAAWIVAPEALIHAADRRGCRLEFSAPSARRAAGEWQGTLAARGDGPAALRLVEFYRSQGADYLADLGSRRAGPERRALHDEVRRRYDVLLDRPEVFLARLTRPSIAGSPQPCRKPTPRSR